MPCSTELTKHTITVVKAIVQALGPPNLPGKETFKKVANITKLRSLAGFPSYQQEGTLVQ